MSETVAYRGKAEKLDLKGTIEEICQQAIGKKRDGYQGTFEEYVRDELYHEYVIVGDGLYRVKMESLGEQDVMLAEQKPDGTIELFLQFYNGGCTINEAIEVAIGRMNEN